jgi:Concanavalin A-like lectin/glucanases superfamily
VHGFSVFGYNLGNPIVSGNWSATKPDVGKWYHVVGTRDNTSIKLYVDGILIVNNFSNTATNGTSPAYASPTYAVIGSRVGADGFIQSLRGSLDDIYIYNRAITAEEVTALYQNSKSIPCEDGVIACHPFSVVKTK